VIIRDWLAIEVLQNTYGSFIWSLFDKKLPGLFVLFALFSLYFLYRMLYFYQKDGNLFLCLLSFILMCSAFICVCIDKAFYGGTYDYIYLYQRVYFDIKDVYLASSIFTTLLSCIYDKSWSELKQSLRYDPWGKKYYKYEFDTWHSLMTKFTKRKRKFE
jgi:lipoprotein signal peptidase